MKSTLNKRILACFLTMLMLFTMIPAVSVSALEPSGELSISDLAVTYDKLAGNASTCILDGTSITATAQSKSGMNAANTAAGQTEVTLKNTGSDAAALSFLYTGSGVNSLTIDNTECDTGSGSFTKALASGESVVIVFSSEKGAITTKKLATLTITDIALSVEKDVSVTFKSADNGSYSVDGDAVNAETTKVKKSTESFAVSAESAAGYNFFGWYNETTGKYLSYSASSDITLTDDAVVYPVFVSETIALFGVGNTSFISLTEAGNFASTSPIKTVVLLNNGTLSGSHTIPAGVTLLIPFDDANTLYTEEPECTSYYVKETQKWVNVDWVQPTAYRTLTLASDADITVNGAISVSGKHAASNGGKPYCGAPSGPVGWVNMLEGSKVTLNDGANLYAWGYIQGAGTITAKSGAGIYENFQFTDFRGGSYSMQLAMTDGLVFPINQYYVQNIEVPTVFEAGAKETLYTSAYASSMRAGGAATFIGEGGMFVVESGYIVKDYIENRDRLQVDIFGDITMSGIAVDVGAPIDSSTFILPITNNISINLSSGTTTIGQSMALLPGVEMTVGQEAILVVGASEKELLWEEKNEFNTGGYHLIVYDYDEWCYGIDLVTFEDIVENPQYAFGSNTGFRALPYAPGRTYDRTVEDLKDAVLDVNGMIVADGNLYSTMGGGVIKSSEKTGTIVMQSGSGYDILTFQANGGTSLGIPMNSASLMNGDGSYVTTGPNINDDGSTPYTEPGTIFNYCARHDLWYSGDDHAECPAVESYNVTWMNGTESLGTTEFEEGTVPSYPGIDDPSKAADNSGHYTFAGWSATNGGSAIELPAVTGDVTYYAVFTAEAHADTDKEAVDGKHYCDGCNYLMYSCYDKANDGNHECDYGCGRVLSECSGGAATCKVQAECTECGQSYGELAKHSYNGVVTDPTCEDKGYTTYTCLVCGDSYVTDEVAALKHDMQLTAEKVEPECEVPGKEAVYTCANGCGKTTGGDEIAALEHDMQLTAEKVEPECEVPGKEAVYTCANGCGKTEGGDEIPMLGHKEGEVVVEDVVEATCTEDGSYCNVVYCTVCGEELSHDTVVVPATGHTYSELNGKCICGDAVYGWNMLDDSWYFFFEDNTRAEGITRVPYPTEEINGVKYEADKETLEYSENKGIEFIDAETGLFFFGEDGKFLSTFTGITEYENADRYIKNGFMPWNPGFAEVDGVLYYFIGDVNVGGNTPANGDTYLIRINGFRGYNKNEIYNFADGKFSGADGIIGGKYYENSKLMMGNGLTAVEVDGETKYIYVRSNGEVVTGAKYWVGKNNYKVVPGYYEFDADSYMLGIKTTDMDGVCFENDGYYFYENGVRAYKGLIKYTGTADNGTVYENDWIYVRSNGKLATGKYWASKNDSGELKSQYYDFDETGKMIIKNGFVEENGTLYYYVNGVKQMALGLIEIEGKYYYVRSAGEVVRGREYWISNANETGVSAQSYYFDENGVLQNPVYDKDEAVNGVVDGYYYENGKIVCGKGLVELEDGSIIYVRSNGQLATGKYWPTTLNGILSAGQYDFGTDGRLVIA